VLGTTTRVTGFACTPTSPASLAVIVGPGAIFASAVTDPNPYGSLGADASTTLMKQGIATSSTTLTITPPGTTGQSMVYLIEASLSETDGGAQTLAFFDAVNPEQPYMGPLNAGTSSNTLRQCRPVIQLKAGTPATTGSQVAPTADSGFTPLWAITVANGASTIVSGNIAAATSSKFITPLS
jgi:hypothetical protein